MSYGQAPFVGRVYSFRSHNFPQHSLKHENRRARIVPVHEGNPVAGQWRLVPGLADPSCVSIESLEFPNHFFRHRNYELWLDNFDGSDLYRKDATFRVVPGLADNDAHSFESVNFPGHFIRHQNYVLFIHRHDGSPLLAADATFLFNAKN